MYCPFWLLCLFLPPLANSSSLCLPVKINLLRHHLQLQSTTLNILPSCLPPSSYHLYRFSPRLPSFVPFRPIFIPCRADLYPLLPTCLSNTLFRSLARSLSQLAFSARLSSLLSYYSRSTILPDIYVQSYRYTSIIHAACPAYYNILHDVRLSRLPTILLALLPHRAHEGDLRDIRNSWSMHGA